MDEIKSSLMVSMWPLENVTANNNDGKDDVEQGGERPPIIPSQQR